MQDRGDVENGEKLQEEEEVVGRRYIIKCRVYDIGEGGSSHPKTRPTIQKLK